MCPECGHTMKNLGMDTVGRKVFWCPRCGTVKTETEGTLTVRQRKASVSVPEVWEEHEAPFLVLRARNLITMLEKEALRTRAQISADAVADSIGKKRNDLQGAAAPSRGHGSCSGL